MKLPKDCTNLYENILNAARVRYRYAKQRRKRDERRWEEAVRLLDNMNEPNIFIRKSGAHKGCVVGIPVKIADTILQVLVRVAKGELPITEAHHEPALQEEDGGDTAFVRNRRYRDSAYAMMAALYSQLSPDPAKRVFRSQLIRAAQEFTDHPIEFNYRTRTEGALKAMPSLERDGLVDAGKEGRIGGRKWYTLTQSGLQACYRLFEERFHPDPARGGGPDFRLVRPAALHAAGWQVSRDGHIVRQRANQALPASSPAGSASRIGLPSRLIDRGDRSTMVEDNFYGHIDSDIAAAIAASLSEGCSRGSENARPAAQTDDPIFGRGYNVFRANKSSEKVYEEDGSDEESAFKAAVRASLADAPAVATSRSRHAGSARLHPSAAAGPHLSETYGIDFDGNAFDDLGIVEEEGDGDDDDDIAAAIKASSEEHARGQTAWKEKQGLRGSKICGQKRDFSSSSSLSSSSSSLPVPVSTSTDLSAARKRMRGAAQPTYSVRIAYGEEEHVGLRAARMAAVAEEASEEEEGIDEEADREAPGKEEVTATAGLGKGVVDAEEVRLRRLLYFSAQKAPFVDVEVDVAGSGARAGVAVSTRSRLETLSGKRSKARHSSAGGDKSPARSNNSSSSSSTLKPARVIDLTPSRIADADSVPALQLFSNRSNRNISSSSTLKPARVIDLTPSRIADADSAPALLPFSNRSNRNISSSCRKNNHSNCYNNNNNNNNIAFLSGPAFDLQEVQPAQPQVPCSVHWTVAATAGGVGGGMPAAASNKPFIDLTDSRPTETATATATTTSAAATATCSLPSLPLSPVIDLTA